MKIMDNVTYKCVVYTKDVDGEEEEENIKKYMNDLCINWSHAEL